MSDERFDVFDLIGQYVDGELSEADANQLAGMISKNPSLARYVQKNFIMNYLLERKFALIREQDSDFDLEKDNKSMWETMQALLRELVLYEKNAKPLHPETIIEAPENWQSKRFLKKCLQVMSLSLLFLMVGLLSLKEIHKEYRSETGAPEDFVVKIAEMIEPVWEDNTVEYRRGQTFEPETFDLKSGLVKLEFGSQAEVLLEGPAKFMVTDKLKGFCYSGKISICVPKCARGFEIGTPYGSFIDRGTEFFLNIGESESKMDVIKGSVDYVSSAKAIPLNSKAGEALCVNLREPPKKSLVTESEYLSPAMFQRKLLEYDLTLESKQNIKRRVLELDPELQAHFKFNLSGSHTFDNLSKTGSRPDITARISKGTLTQGSLATRKALRFDDLRDQIRIPCRSNLNEMTFLISIRQDRIPSSGTIILASDTPTSEAGTFVFQVLPDGSLQLRVRKQDESRSNVYITDPFYKKNRIGIWSELAVVYSIQEKKISFYADGYLLKSLPLIDEIPLYLDQFAIGGNLEMGRNKALLFNGAVEEFMLFTRALSQKEIEQLRPQE